MLKKLKLQKKPLNYDAMLQWTTTYNCSLNCNYCFENYYKNTTKTSKINISALIKTLNKTNKSFKVSFTGGGEPFLTPNFIDACIEITKNHFIRITTNLTSEKVELFTEKIDPERVEFIFASLHIKELERLNLIDKYVNNFHLCKEKGFNIDAAEVAHPSLLNEVEKYKKSFRKKGIQLNFIPYIGEYKGKFYPDSYTNKEFKIFGLDLKDIKRFYQKRKLCNAGYNVGVAYPNGNVKYCFIITKYMGNIYDEIKFNDKLIQCPVKFCGCPLKALDIYLFKKAINNPNVKVVRSIFLKEYLLKYYLLKILRKVLTFNIYKQIAIFSIIIENKVRDIF